MELVSKKQIMILIDFFIPFLSTFLITKYSIPFLRKNIIASPSKRGLHTSAKPSGGGTFFISIYSLISLLKGDILPLLSIPIAIVGLIDDKFNLSYKIKIIVQTISVLIIIIFINNNSNNFISLFLGKSFLSYFIFIFIGICIINFINFMDGIDGLVVGSLIIIFISINNSIIYLIPIIGALLGFLKLNWQPSKIFMGDSGSLYLGSFLVSIMFNTESTFDFLKILLLISPLVIDPSITILQRLNKGEDIFKAHKLHLYQRLVSAGISHSKVSLLYIFSVSILGLVYRFSDIYSLIITTLIILFLGVIIDNKYALKLNK